MIRKEVFQVTPHFDFPPSSLKYPTAAYQKLSLTAKSRITSTDLSERQEKVKRREGLVEREVAASLAGVFCPVILPTVELCKFSLMARRPSRSY